MTGRRISVQTTQFADQGRLALRGAGRSTPSIAPFRLSVQVERGVFTCALLRNHRDPRQALGPKAPSALATWWANVGGVNRRARTVSGAGAQPQPLALPSCSASTASSRVALHREHATRARRPSGSVSLMTQPTRMSRFAIMAAIESTCRPSRQAAPLKFRVDQASARVRFG